MKATLSDGTVLEGQPGEIAEAIREIASRGVSANSGRSAGNGQPHASSSIIWTEDRIRALWSFLYGKQKDLVSFLVKRGGKASIQEVMAALGLRKGTEVAGLRSCITRNARRETGYKKAQLIVWERGAKGDWHYKIIPDALSVLRQLV